jgi:hypothetical protein
MKFLRAIMGKTKSDRIRNAHIREELRMKDTENQIEGNRLKWFGYVKRMDEHRICKNSTGNEDEQKRPRGRPCTWWIDQVKRDIERRVHSCGNAELMQEWTGRDSWRLLCKS